MSASKNILRNQGSLKTSSLLNTSELGNTSGLTNTSELGNTLLTNTSELGNTNNLLQPYWLGKIDWSHGISTSQNKYKGVYSNIMDEYKAPVWDDMYEYRKSFLTRKYNLFDNNNENICNLQDNDNQFITISKNKKTFTKNTSSSKPIKFSMNDGNDVLYNYDY